MPVRRDGDAVAGAPCAYDTGLAYCIIIKPFRILIFRKIHALFGVARRPGGFAARCACAGFAAILRRPLVHRKGENPRPAAEEGELHAALQFAPSDLVPPGKFFLLPFRVHVPVSAHKRHTVRERRLGGNRALGKLLHHGGMGVRKILAVAANRRQVMHRHLALQRRRQRKKRLHVELQVSQVAGGGLRGG